MCGSFTSLYLIDLRVNRLVRGVVDCHFHGKFPITDSALGVSQNTYLHWIRLSSLPLHTRIRAGRRQDPGLEYPEALFDQTHYEYIYSHT